MFMLNRDSHQSGIISGKHDLRTEKPIIFILNRNGKLNITI